MCYVIDERYFGRLFNQQINYGYDGAGNRADRECAAQQTALSLFALFRVLLNECEVHTNVANDFQQEDHHQRDEIQTHSFFVQHARQKHQSEEVANQGHQCARKSCSECLKDGDDLAFL